MTHTHDGARSHHLTPGQQRLWFLHRLSPDNPAYNVVIALRLRGPLHEAALRGALVDVTRRHAALRTVFPVEPGGHGPVACVAADGPPLRLVDLSALPPEEAHTEARRFVDAASARSADLVHGPITHWTLLRAAPDDHLLILLAHHIVFDGGSLPVVCAELERGYRELAHGRPLPARAGAPPAPAAGEVPADSLEYWRGTLADAPAQPLVLPVLAGRRRATGPATEPAALVSGRCALSGDGLRRLRALAAEEGCTTQLLLLTALICLLHRYGGQEDVVVGIPVALREKTEDAERVGLYVNLLPIRVRVGTGSLRFREVLRRTRRAWLDAHEHRGVPFERLVEEFHTDATPTVHPFFSALFAYQQAPPLPRLEGIETTLVPVAPAAAKYELTITATEDEKHISFDLDIDSRSANRAEADATARHLRALLTAAVDAPERAVADLPLLDGAERRALGPYWPVTQRAAHTVANAPDLWVPAHRLFEEQARRRPDAVAVVHGAHSLTYAALNRRANQLAQELVARGAGPESVVGVCLRRTSQLPVTLLAVLKAGAAYLPLDPAYPTQRLSGMIEDASMGLLVTERHLLHSTGLDALTDPAGVVLMDDDGPVLRHPGHDLVGPETDVHPNSLAYVLFTSGSTGRPKGIALQHGNLDTFLRWAGRTFSAEELTAVLATTSVSFDVSVFELFAPLTHGGTVLLGDNALHVPHMPAAATATLLSTVPTAVDALTEADAIPRSVRTVNIGGETLQRGVVDRLARRVPGVRVHNLYGPSETTTHSANVRVPLDSEEPPTIGRPLLTVLMWVADRGHRPVPVGVAGEIVIGGEGLARGYVGRPRLTAERFAPDPASGTGGGRLYITGDQARVNGHGELVFLGRRDAQIKLRGVRIEPEEVEAVTRAHPAVLDAAVVVERHDGTPVRLVAYVKVRSEDVAAAKTLTADLLAHLRGRLPRAMVPAELRFRAELPLNSNGKLDRGELTRRHALEPGRTEATATPAAPPRTELEKVVAAIWCEVLELPHVGLHDNFLELGGNSLLLLKLHRELCDAVHPDLTLVDLFAWPTVAAIAEHFATLTDGGAATGAAEGTAGAADRGRRRRRSAAAAGRRAPEARR
ncbi:amino acid adenylation domain-containing protein [Streptomyces massasporeus]|uniref:non-ribosomal peptide synthetase n=1 Tax=Streptomyces massasporeus TaxID=67324 RepID=UPI0036FC9740